MAVLPVGVLYTMIRAGSMASRVWLRLVALSARFGLFMGLFDPSVSNTGAISLAASSGSLQIQRMIAARSPGRQSRVLK